MEYIVAALETPDQGLESLRLDDCNLRSAALEVLCECHSRKVPHVLTMLGLVAIHYRPYNSHVFATTYLA